MAKTELLEIVTHEKNLAEASKEEILADWQREQQRGSLKKKLLLLILMLIQW